MQIHPLFFLPMARYQISLPLICVSILLLHFFHCCSSQKPCPRCGTLEVPYPLSTNPSCGNTDYKIHCDSASQKLYFNALNGSSYQVVRIMPTIQRMVVQPSPWILGTCMAQDMPKSEGLWLNQTLPFNITSSNTIFLFDCSPRLFVSPLNCTPSSLCHRYLDSSGHVEKARAPECANALHPCCTFVAGGLPSAYKIRLHSSGCQAFRSILHLDTEKPASQWEEGIEIQWTPPLEPPCKTQKDCLGHSTCSATLSCICNKGYHWDRISATCLVKNRRPKNFSLALKLSLGVAVFFLFCLAVTAISFRRPGRFFGRAKRVRAREEMLRRENGGKTAMLFSVKELKKATNGFSKNMILGIGGFGEVYRGELRDGRTVAIKSAKVGNIKSTQQVLNELSILSQVNHKNLVKLLGYCVEAEQPLMVYEYISNGTLHDHLHGKYSNSATSLDWKTRLRIGLQTAEALAYLHSAAYTPIYHRDVKSTNILLDDEYNAKVSDFGLSRLACPGLSHVSTCAQGTVGYLDPEYYRNYQLNEKSDVYSFGVVLLELLTSQKAIDFSRDSDDVNLAIYVSQKASVGSVMEVVDKGLLRDESCVPGLRIFSELALTCLKETKGERPTMTDVVQELKRIAEMIK